MPSIAPSPYLSEIAIPPGETIRDMLRDLGMTQRELATRMKRPPNKINEIIKGKREITVETALELELTLGLPADYWINLEKNYRLTLARLEEDQRLSEEIKTLKMFPLNEMCKHGWIRKLKDPRLQVRELLAFFGIARFSQLSQIENLAPAWRKSKKKKACAYALSAWLRKGVLQAGQIQVSKYDGKALKGQVSELRSMTLLDDFHDRLVHTCAKHGVALVFVPHLPKSYVNGAAYWLNEKAVIQLSLRYKFADIIWFNFFHELGHILLHSDRKHKAFLDEDFRNDSSFTEDDPDREDEANSFAQESLIPTTAYTKLLGSEFSKPAIVRNFSAHFQVHSGIIVGRLQHEGKLHYSQLNDLRAKLRFADASDCD